MGAIGVEVEIGVGVPWRASWWALRGFVSRLSGLSHPDEDECRLDGSEELEWVVSLGKELDEVDEADGEVRFM